MISVLCKLFGIQHVEYAEDIVHDTFLLATETWERNGIPANPPAWLYTVAKNKAKDFIKRNDHFKSTILPAFQYENPSIETFEFDLSEKSIMDSQLQMMFAICNPIIPIESQIGLSLRILCGFGIDEIAEALLSNKETINKRLFRAKDKIRSENISLVFPAPYELNKRLDSVLKILYLLFNEGYYSKTQSKTLNKNLCLEAMELLYLLLKHEQTNLPRVNALMSLMCFHASRFEARIDEFGEHILYEAQDRTLWDDELIAKGNYYLIKSATGNDISIYHIEASIAYWHCTKIDSPNKWENILQLYNKRIQLEYSPIVALNRTYALSKVYGQHKAIEEAEKLQLNDNYLYFALLGNLYTPVNAELAINHYNKAISLTSNTAAKRSIEKQMDTVLKNAKSNQ